MTKFLSWILFVGIVLFITAYVVNRQLESTVVEPVASSNNYSSGTFKNDNPRRALSFGEYMTLVKRWFTEEKVDPEPTKPIPLKALSKSQLEALNDDEVHLVKLGHSSILLKVSGEYWLLDPVFSERASPFSFTGPKRFQPTPIQIEDLPPISKVLISHNHYDHLDKATIQALASSVGQFLVPLGVEGDLEKWGVSRDKIQKFHWWEELQTENALVVFTPTQHFSGRGLGDENRTLWGSWVVKTDTASLYFSGDSGYFAGFEAIGDKYGPFDITMLEVGAYNKDWPDIHMLPEEAVQAHIDLRGSRMMPIHNSTFDLAFHPWYEPLERVATEAESREVNLITPLVGELFTAKQTEIGSQWWPAVKQ